MLFVLTFLRKHRIGEVGEEDEDEKRVLKRKLIYVKCLLSQNELD